MNPFWTILLTLASVSAGTGLCFWLLHKAREVPTTVWILGHIVCSMIRILALNGAGMTNLWTLWVTILLVRPES